MDGAGIEGWYNEGAGSDYTYRWFATLLEADDFIPEDLAAAGSPGFRPPIGPVSLGALRTPERGTAERSALTRHRPGSDRARDRCARDLSSSRR